MSNKANKDIEDICDEYGDLLVSIMKTKKYQDDTPAPFPKSKHSKDLFYRYLIEDNKATRVYYVDNPTSHKDQNSHIPIQRVSMVDFQSFERTCESARLIELGLQDCLEFIYTSGNFGSFKHYTTMKYDL